MFLHTCFLSFSPETGQRLSIPEKKPVNEDREKEINNIFVNLYLKPQSNLNKQLSFKACYSTVLYKKSFNFDIQSIIKYQHKSIGW